MRERNAFSRILIAILANLAGLVAADYFIAGVAFGGTAAAMLAAAAALAALHAVVKPLLKLLFGPVIVLTLGLAMIVVNALLLVLLDFLFQTVSIQGIAALIYASLVIAIANIVARAITRP